MNARKPLAEVAVGAACDHLPQAGMLVAKSHTPDTSDADGDRESGGGGGGLEADGWFDDLVHALLADSTQALFDAGAACFLAVSYLLCDAWRPLGDDPGTSQSCVHANCLAGQLRLVQ